jgi:hypothetical protein
LPVTRDQDISPVPPMNRSPPPVLKSLGAVFTQRRCGYLDSVAFAAGSEPGRTLVSFDVRQWLVGKVAAHTREINHRPRADLSCFNQFFGYEPIARRLGNAETGFQVANRDPFRKQCGQLVTSKVLHRIRLLE